MLTAALLGCQPMRLPPPTGDRPAPPVEGSAPAEPAPRVEKAPSEATPQLHASVTLTETGRALLEAGRTDAAIREFERAVSLNPHHGPGYYYLAEAWLAKGNTSQAESFHQLARLHLRDRPEWKQRLSAQSNRLQRGKAGG